MGASLRACLLRFGGLQHPAGIAIPGRAAGQGFAAEAANPHPHEVFRLIFAQPQPYQGVGGAARLRIQGAVVARAPARTRPETEEGPDPLGPPPPSPGPSGFTSSISICIGGSDPDRACVRAPPPHLPAFSPLVFALMTRWPEETGSQWLPPAPWVRWSQAQSPHPWCPRTPSVLLTPVPTPTSR